MVAKKFKPIIVAVALSLLILVVYCSGESEIYVLMDEAYELTDKEEYDEAEELLKRAISKSRQIYRADNYIEGVCYIGLTTLYINQERYNDAENVCLKSLSIFKKNNVLHNVEGLNSKSLLGTIYMYQKRYEKAESLLTDVANNYVANTERDTLWYYANTYVLARTLSFLENYCEAESLYKNYIDFYDGSSNEDISCLARAYFGLSIIYIKQALFLKAELITEKIFSKLKLKYAKEYELHGYCLITMSIIQENYHNYQKSDSLYNNSIDLFKKHYGEEDENIAEISDRLAKIYDRLGFQNNKMKYEQKAANIRAALEQDSIPDPEDLNLYINR